MSALPAGWRVAQLAEIADIVMGQSPPGSSYNASGVGLPFFQGKAEFGSLTTTVRKWTTAGTKFAAAGDILISVRAPVGPTNLAPVECALGRGLAGLRARPVLDQRFLLWALRAQESDIAALGKGSTFQAITGRQLREITIPLPSLQEQRRIVATLEAELSRLSRATGLSSDARTRGHALVRRLLFDAAVGTACRGADDTAQLLRGLDLGGPRPPSLQLPSDWRWLKWHEVGTSQNGRAFPSADYQSTGVRLLRPGNLRSDGVLGWTVAATRYLPQAYADRHPDLLLREDDIVMNLTAQSLKGDFLGRVCRVGSGDTSLLNQRLARLVPKKVSAAFATVVFRSPLFRTYVSSLNAGSLIQHMFTKQIAEFWFPVPTPRDETLVLERLEGQLAAWERTAAAVDRVAARSDACRRSLLAAAFSGALTPGSLAGNHA